jgi:excinuclease UvrABC nuclease subunit
MPVSGNTYPFTRKNVDGSPERPGVYALLSGDRVIYYGKATKSIRSRLQCHLRGDEGRCTQGATHYKREVTSQPTAREKELLDAFKARSGRLPRCNERSA